MIMQTIEEKSKAFVIMPFEKGYDEIYALFIHETLVLAGYNVTRADDMKTCQNILKDIIHGIAYGDLIVADLSDSNPNVYYELGLAHTLGKPVILLTQNINEIPFDLRPYRIIPYGTHFAEMKTARGILLETAQGLLNGKIPFGNPISDFLPEHNLFSSGSFSKIRY